ncbi:MAG: hypothetical protein APF77_22915 [Clostridia bacterium BRH_c25]|nr:MAG: hypothetical protein APF77_22915 [Clostridia bacterium BRH_c25]
MLYIFFAVLILLMLYLMPIAVSIDMNKDNENDNITVGLKTLYGLLKLKTEVPILEITFENGKPVLKYKAEIADGKRSKLFAGFTKIFSMTEGEGLYEAYKKNKRIVMPVVEYISKKIRIYGFNLKLSLGTGDAAATGVLYGAAWIVIGNVMALTSSYLNIIEPRIAVIPIFSKVNLSVDFSCIISMRLGHIINAGIRAIPALLSGMGK